MLTTCGEDVLGFHRFINFISPYAKLAAMTFQSRMAPPTPTSAEMIKERSDAADLAFRAYDFGQWFLAEDEVDGVSGECSPDLVERLENEPRDWQFTSMGNEWTRPAYVLNMQGDIYNWVRLIFTVRFDPSSRSVQDVYALNPNGSICGRKSWDNAFFSRDESVLKGPWRWRWIDNDQNSTVALALETTAEPIRDPVIMQALLD